MFSGEPTPEGAVNFEGKNTPEKLMAQIAETLRQSGFPVLDNCRVDMSGFKKIYSEDSIQSDKLRFNSMQIGWREKASLENRRKPDSNSKQMGEKLEELKTIIFHKFLQGEFFTLRASEHDDVHNKVDNLIIEKSTGNIIGAFDEVADIDKGSRLEEKCGKIVNLNSKGKGGVNLKYGFKLADEDGEKKIVPTGGQTHIPILYLAMAPYTLEYGLKNLSSLTDKSDVERDLFSRFVKLIKAQVIEMQRLKMIFDPELMAKVQSFADKLSRVNEGA